MAVEDDRNQRLRGIRTVPEIASGGETVRRKLRILYVAYPLLPVTDASVGGAEQMLSVLERRIAERGHETIVAACEGSQAAGKLFATGDTPTGPDRFEERETEHSARIVEFIRNEEQAGRAFDLVHDKSGHFWRHTAALDVPVLATLHLPRPFYRPEPFDPPPANLFFNCVSQSQARTFTGLSKLLGVVQNGIELHRFPVGRNKGDYVLWIGRLCEEKGAHVAIDVARNAGYRLILAGDVYPFSYHQDYFKREILPRIESRSSAVEFVRRPSFDKKVELLQHAKALLVPALVDETSSLVAMEAMACGTPVVAFRRGALPEVIAEAETGFVVNTCEEMAEALGRVDKIAPQDCRARVESRYSAERMASEYEALYQRVLAAAKQRRALEAA